VLHNQDLGPLQTYFLTTAATTLVGLLLVPDGGSEAENEGNCEWVKIQHLLVVNKLFFGKVDNEHFYASSGQYISYKKNDHTGWLHIHPPWSPYRLGNQSGLTAKRHY
jgi:hypothetical protein